MSETNSPHWYRLANLKPRLHSHIEIHRHDYRGKIWHVMEDVSTGRNHRFNPAAYRFIGLLDGKHTVQDIFALLEKELGDSAPSQQELIQLLGQLHSADLIQTDALINTEELFERQARFRQTKFAHRLMNPVSQQLPLWDPDAFLNQHVAKVKTLFCSWTALLWLLTVGFFSLQLITHWPTVYSHFAVNALSPDNLIILFILYVPIKFLHELAHAFATKLKGGEVHEMGINFLLFIPVPYVNVSSAAHFRHKKDRMLVSAAGILVETFLAALGLGLFLSAEPGLVQDIGFNIFLTGGISSLFFNGNPLLKYDGYYLLADALEIPNLYQRSLQYWRYFFQRYVLGLRQVASPATALGETFWFIAYSIVALVYRLGLLWFICVFVTEKYFFFGILLALWLVSAQVLLPLYKALRFVFTNPNLGRKRNQAVIASAAIAIAAIGLFGFMPIPSYTTAEGVVWLPDNAQIKAEQDGFVEALQIQSGQNVQVGTDVLTMKDDALTSQARIARAKVIELQGQYRAERETDRVNAEIAKQELHVAQSELESLNTKTQAMTVKAKRQGRILIPDAEDLPGRYLRHGEPVGFILDENPPSIRVAILQDNMGQVRGQVKDIKVRLVNDPAQEYDAELIRQAPEATNKLPSPALATTGGGKIPVDPKNTKDAISLQKVFLVDLKFKPKEKNIPIGARAFVRINHGGEPLSRQLYRRIRQTFLRQFNV